MEAKLAGCKVITNSLIGASYEDYNYSDRNASFYKKVRKFFTKAKRISLLKKSTKREQASKENN